MKRSTLLGAAVLVTLPVGCGKDEPAGDPWMTGMSQGEGGSGDSGDDDAGGPCSLRGSDAPLVLETAEDSAPGRVTALAIAGPSTIACGDGFLVVVGGGSLDLPGACTGLTVVDDATVAASTASGSVVLVDVSGPSAAATVQAGTAAYDVASNGTTIAVALGEGGVATYDASLGSPGTLTSALDARALAPTADGWLVGGIGHATLVSAQGTASAPLELQGTVTDVEVDGEVAVLGRGPFGVERVQLGAQVTSTAIAATEGSALDVALVDGAVLVATGAGLHRYELEGSALALSARAPRPDESELVGEWIAAVAAADGAAVAAIGASVRGVSVGESAAGPVALLPRTTTSLFAHGDGEVVVLMRNGGNADMHVGELQIDGPLAVDSVAGAEPREGCEDQWTVEPGGSLLITLMGEVSDPALADLTVATSDPNHETLRLPVEINRPSLAVGDPAPDFTMISFAGDVIDLDVTSGEVVFLKLFSYS